jgi:ABC-type branched-subunit amino acid transport system substrate-binding protein
VKALRKGDHVGIISQQGGGAATDQRDALANGLKPALRKAGFRVAAEAELPCPETSQTCEQHTAAIQRMKDAGVNVVFLTASALAGQSTVKAAKDLDFHPRWVTIGDNVTDTEAHFYEPVKDEYDGAYGINTVFDDPTAAAVACNRIAHDRAQVDFPKGSDGYGFAAVTCLQVQVLAQAIASIRGNITQASLIAALEAMRTVPTAHGPTGSFGPDKHDAGNHVFVSQYHASSGKFQPVGGGRPKAVRVR